MDKLRSSSISSQGFGSAYKKVLKDNRLTKVAKLIHCYLCSYAGSGDTAFPSVKLLCYDLDLNESTYYENLLYLKAYGYITVEQNQDLKGKFINNIYTIEQYPEQYENIKYKIQIADMLIKRKEKNDKARKKKPNTDNPGTDEKPSMDNPSTDNPCTDNPGTNINSNNINILSIPIEDIRSYTQEVLNKDLPDNEFIKQLTLFSFEGNCFIFTVTDDWYKSIIEMRYIDRIKLALTEALKAYNKSDLSFEVVFKV